MIKNYLLITFRNLLKNKVFILINILGMSIAIGCCIVGYYSYDFNTNFNLHNKNAASIYRINSVRSFQNQLSQYGYVPVPLGDAIRQNIPDVDKVVRYNGSWADMRIGEEIFNTSFSYVDNDFFNVFTFDFVEGNASDVKEKTKIFISETTAVRFFGKDHAVGKTVTMVLAGDKTKEWTVAGVFKTPPPNSSFTGESIFTSYANYFDMEPELENGTKWNYRNTTFVMVNNSARLQAIEDRLKPYAENNNKVREDFVMAGFKLDPLVGMGARDRNADRDGVWTRSAAPASAVIGTAVMGVLILLIACFNLTNTAISVSSKRLKEIGIRKVMGSNRSQLIIQFLGETMLICFVALGVGMLMAEFVLVPAFNSLWEFMKLSTDYTGNPKFLLFMIGVLIFTGLVAGSYPALYVTKFQPIAILKGKLSFGGSSLLSKILLLMQFAISLIAVVASFAFSENARYQRDFDLGFDHKGVVFTWVNSGNDFETYRNALSSSADIISIAGSKDHINSQFYDDPIKSEGKEIESDIMDIGDDYLKTIGLQLTEGRDFRKKSETDYKESVIISEKLARSFGWQKAIGKEIIWMDTVKLYVIGVVKDTYVRGLWREVRPMMLRYVPQEKYRHVVVSTEAKNLVAVNKLMEKKWKEIFPNRAYTGRYMDEGLVEALQVNTNIVQMFSFLGVIAIMLSATGLFTLVSLNIIKKMKEIGIRKVFGASIGNITRIINTEFVIILLIASVLGALAGSYVSSLLMSSIWSYYKTPGLVTIVVSVVILLSISAAAIGWKVYSAAKMNPVKTLRDE